MSMSSRSSRGFSQLAIPDPILSDEEIAALKRACAPVGSVSFPSIEMIRTLRQHGYVEITLGGLQITPQGLERLLRERKGRIDLGPR